MPNPLEKLFSAPSKRGGTLAWPNDSADRGYTIFFTGRCGSTELVDVLTQSGTCGAPDEFFNEEFIPHHNEWQCQQISAYIANLIQNKSAGRVFGFKVDGFRHRQLCEFVDPMSYFPKSSFTYIFMNRRNLLEQAYSYAHAKKTGVWHLSHQSAAGDEEPEAIDISDASLWREIALVLEQEFYFERYFIENSLSVLRIDYEMLCASKPLLIADVMFTLGRGSTEIQATVAGLRERYRKMRYAAAKFQRVVEFRSKYGWQLAYLSAYRGRLPLASVRNYLCTHAGLDLSQVQD